MGYSDRNANSIGGLVVPLLHVTLQSMISFKCCVFDCHDPLAY